MIIDALIGKLICSVSVLFRKPLGSQNNIPQNQWFNLAVVKLGLGFLILK